ncbi:hypothetical protein SEA_GALACTICA_58 [Streptomyces phage Galactica]|nr:hypothetical protein SEA_GALACTICA_58 [Streptomyces phage Galactica]
MKRNEELRTPWSPNGRQLLHYPDRSRYPGMKWRDNSVLKLRLKMLGTERGRSAAYFRWEVLDGDLPAGTILPMFITDVGHVIMQGLPQPGGVVEGEFFVVKRGQNYGITPLAPAENGQERPTETTGAPSGS